MSIPSGFGVMRLRKGYSVEVQPNPQDKIRCKLYFTLAFNCAVMGYVDLVFKVIEILLFGVVLFCLGVMKVFPWRKQALADHLKDSKKN